MLTRSTNINKHYCLNCGKEYQPQTDVDEYDSKPGKRHGKKTVNKKVYRPDYLTQTT
jgi:hypothetical protein